MFRSLRHLFAIANRKPARHSRRRLRQSPVAACVSVERLEDRTLLSAGALDVTTAGDGTATLDSGAVVDVNWDSSVISPNGTTPIAHAADMDGDGDMDVLSASSSDDKIAWHENTAGDGTAWTEHTISTTADWVKSVYAADMDGDGDLDVLSASFDSSTIAWHENTAGDGTAWTEHTISTAADGAYSVFAADIDGDGDLDALSASLIDDTIAWHENTTGDGSAWTEHTIFTAAATEFVNYDSVSAADIDGDGDMDVLGVSQHEIVLYRNRAGDGSAWNALTISTAADHDAFWANSAFAADVDGDGDMDVVSSWLAEEGGAGTIAWHENTLGDGLVWTDHTIATTSDFNTLVFGADVDGDGDLDVLSKSLGDGKIAWHQNSAGDGSAWTSHTINLTNDFGSATISAADIDGDGDVDIVAGWYYTMRWYENPVVQSTEDQLEDLTEAVDDLLSSGALNGGQSNSLLAQLNAALDSLDANQDADAAAQLEAFINHVNAYIKGGILSEEEGQALIDTANVILASLA